MTVPQKPPFRRVRNLRLGTRPERIAGVLARLVGIFGLATIVRIAFKVPPS